MDHSGYQGSHIGIQGLKSCEAEPFHYLVTGT
uniref:Uncharacterized protein n=1 Tax=Arundo donax TaxID=35708 RepID=A0A0A9BN43_ARUDO